MIGVTEQFLNQKLPPTFTGTKQEISEANLRWAIRQPGFGQGLATDVRYLIDMMNAGRQDELPGDVNDTIDVDLRRRVFQVQRQDGSLAEGAHGANRDSVIEKLIAAGLRPAEVNVVLAVSSQAGVQGSLETSLQRTYNPLMAATAFHDPTKVNKVNIQRVMDKYKDKLADFPMPEASTNMVKNDQNASEIIRVHVVSDKKVELISSVKYRACGSQRQIAEWNGDHSGYNISMKTTFDRVDGKLEFAGVTITLQRVNAQGDIQDLPESPNKRSTAAGVTFVAAGAIAAAVIGLTAITVSVLSLGIAAVAGLVLAAGAALLNKSTQNTWTYSASLAADRMEEGSCFPPVVPASPPAPHADDLMDKSPVDAHSVAASSTEGSDYRPGSPVALDDGSDGEGDGEGAHPSA